MAVEHVLMRLLSPPGRIGLQQREQISGINRNDVFDIGLIE